MATTPDSTHRTLAHAAGGVQPEYLASGALRVFVDRGDGRTGAVGPGDEEECFTAHGRKVGVWLTTEALRGPFVLAADVAAEVLAGYEVTSADDPHRCFVVPAVVLASVAFAPS